MPQLRPITAVINIAQSRGNSERAFIVGKTGTGKSTVAVALLQSYRHVIALDTKRRFTLPNSRMIVNPDELGEIETTDPTPVLYRPEPEYDNFETHNAFFHWVYRRGNCTLYVDEVRDVMDGQRVPEWLRHIARKGRSLGIRAIYSSQRPSSIPMDVMSESEHFIVFRLSMADDRKRMAEVTTEEVMRPLEGAYNFWYYNHRMNEPKQLVLQTEVFAETQEEEGE